MLPPIQSMECAPPGPRLPVAGRNPPNQAPSVRPEPARRAWRNAAKLSRQGGFVMGLSRSMIEELRKAAAQA
jgi:hypothetical protein